MTDQTANLTSLPAAAPASAPASASAAPATGDANDQLLPRSTPEQQGLDPAAISRLLDALEAAGLELHSLMVVRHGQVVTEGWWAPYEPTGLHLLYSLSKSFTSTAVGLAVHEGLLSIDDLVTSFFPDSVPADLGPRAARIRVRHLLSMASGHRDDTLDRVDRSNPVSSFLSIEPEEEPGTWFTYNNAATLMLSAILTKVTGGRLLDYLRPRLLEPLGISEANWQGVGDLDLGFSGLHLPTEAIAKLGQLYLQLGSWRGQQLVPRDWVTEATHVQVDNPREPEVDWRQGYGYQFWMGQHGFRGDGAFGQFCLVLPHEDAVVAITAATEDMQSVLTCVWDELWPALQEETAPAQEGVSAELSARLAHLSLPLAPGSHEAPAEIDLPWAAPEVPADDKAAVRVSIKSLEEAADGWRLTLTDPHATYVVGCGYQQWSRSEAEVWPGSRLQVAASGAWTDESTFTAEIALVQTPHRLTLSCDCASGVTTARWNVAPLGPSSASALALELSRG